MLQELKATRFEIDGRQTTLLDEVGLVSGVSGGSILAGYYAAFGDEVFTRFERDFLLVNFQTGLIRQAVSPSTLYRLTSPWYGRSNVLQDRLDTVFRGDDLRGTADAAPVAAPAGHGHGPDHRRALRIHARAVRADLLGPGHRAPVVRRGGVLVGAAPAEPGDVAQLRRQLGRPEQEQLPVNARSEPLGPLAASHRGELRRRGDRPYIHLVDGGLADNLGVRGLLDQHRRQRVAEGEPSGTCRRVPSTRSCS